MRSLIVLCVVACVALTAGMANAAGQISDNALSQMGLSGLQTISDVQGTEIRGMGFAAATTSAYASRREAVTNGSAIASGRGSLAIGASAASSSGIVGIARGPVAISVAIAATR
jgi:hypothetical protein